MLKFNSKNKYLKFLYNVLIIGLLGLIVYVAYQIYLHFTKGHPVTVETNKTLVNQSILTDDEARNLSNNLFLAMNKVGTDEELIRDTLKLLTRADFEKVYKFFGKKTYNYLKGYSSEGWNSWFDSSYHDLRYWLDSELSAEEYVCISEVFQITSAFPLGDNPHSLTAQQYILQYGCSTM